jgi:hypothetical protein
MHSQVGCLQVGQMMVDSVTDTMAGSFRDLEKRFLGRLSCEYKTVRARGRSLFSREQPALAAACDIKWPSAQRFNAREGFIFSAPGSVSAVKPANLVSW